MELQELEDIGLSKNQANFYIYLIRHPGQTAGSIAKNMSIDRSFAYGILNSLVEKGLVSYVVKEDKKIFYASDTGNLLKDIDEKREKTLVLIKKLESIKQKPVEERSVKVYEGKAGLKVYVRDLLESDVFYTLGGGGKEIFEELKYQYPQYLKALSKKNMRGCLITSENDIAAMKKMYKNTDVKVRALKNLNSVASFTIFNNKIAIYSADEKPSVVIIEDRNVSESLKSYFSILWNVSE